VWIVNKIMDRVEDIIRDLVKPHKIMDKKREDIRETSPPERALAPLCHQCH